jgi:O-antigen/teichoic acid export membrane protein
LNRAGWKDELRGIAPRFGGTLGASGVSAMLGLVSGTLAARMLAPDGRGELAQLLLWPQLVATLGILGIELSATFLSADPVRRRNVPATLLAMAGAQGVALALVYAALVPVLFDGAMVRPALMMAPLIPVYLAGAVAIDCLAGTLRFAAFNVVRVALPAVYCTAIIALATTDALSSRTGAAAFVMAHAAADVLALAFVFRAGGFGRFDTSIAWDALRFGARAHFGRLTPQSLGMDTAVIALLLSSRDVGLYAAATAFLAAPGLLASSMGMVLFPHVSASHQAGEQPRLQATFAVYAGAIVTVACLLGAFAAPLVTTLFGNEYAGAVPALRLLALASIPLSLRSFPIEVLRGIGRPGLTSIAEAANWLLFAAAIPTGALLGGLAGTACAVAIAGALSLGVLAVLTVRAGLLHDAPAPSGAQVAEAAA